MRPSAYRIIFQQLVLVAVGFIFCVAVDVVFSMASIIYFDSWTVNLQGGDLTCVGWFFPDCISVFKPTFCDDIYLSEAHSYTIPGRSFFIWKSENDNLLCLQFLAKQALSPTHPELNRSSTVMLIKEVDQSSLWGQDPNFVIDSCPKPKAWRSSEQNRTGPCATAVHRVKPARRRWRLKIAVSE